MLSLLSSLLVLSLTFSGMSIPVPNPQEVITSVISAPAVAPSSVVSVAPAIATPDAVVAPVTFGELTTPSQGGTFADFLALPGGSSQDEPPTSARKAKSHVSRARFEDVVARDVAAFQDDS